MRTARTTSGMTADAQLPTADTRLPTADARLPTPGASRPRPESWLERWRGVTADLARVHNAHSLVEASVDATDGRMIRVGDRWLADFASSNYVGFDTHAEIIEAVPDYLRRWASRSGFARGAGLRRHHEEIEERLTALLRCEDTLVVPAGAEIHAMAIPALAGGGTIFLDRRAQQSIVDGCALARARGAAIVTFDCDDPLELGSLLATHRAGTRLICVDGSGTMTGASADLGSLAMLARAHDALLYLDDEAGFGVIGERGPDELSVYGKRGNAIVRHFGESYDNIVLVAGFAKSYSSLLTFLALPTRLKHALRLAAPIDPHPTPTALAAVATVLEGLAINERRGDALRLELHRMTTRVLDALAAIGIRTANVAGYPIIEVPLVEPGEIESVGRFLLDNGVYAVLGTPPIVPSNEAGVRIQLTSANTEHQVAHLIDVLTAMSGRFRIAGQDPAEARDAVQRGLAQLVAP
jgi:8-amino-7-oxononanoate synthase